MKNILLSVSRVFVGLLFIFSGLIKANDPLGFGYKLQEYFEVFHISFLNDYAPAIAILLCTLEIVLGALLLLGFWANLVAWGLLLLIVFFTFLTFYSAFFEVVTSCGCFGDAIPLTPWQSFSKDLILLAFIIVIFRQRHNLKPLIANSKNQDLIAGLVLVVALGFGIYTYNFQPILDFLPYKIGNNIPSLMVAPPGAPQDVYEITYNLKNKKSGEEKKMTDKEYIKTQIWKDTNWAIVGDPVNKLIKKGYDVKIKDLKITDSQGTDYNKELLENPYYNLVVVAYDLSKANKNGIGDLNALAINAAENYNVRTVLLTSNSAQSAEEFSDENKLVMEIFYADGIPLKSMVRANPGLLLLKNGTVINKWHFHNLPSYDELANKYFRNN
ncbi:BT_3928 family protein [Daejeonella lutea]|uniref:DoxX protein n=1 Tax=Daejeonella lutea TaxID=572036 RepID=A0A1T5CT58_9SPHI|nr:BT_3928 family protein [Daejeonella lutea]SKB62604.1 DoxX protein [Daejeonella lutea]